MVKCFQNVKCLTCCWWLFIRLISPSLVFMKTLFHHLKLRVTVIALFVVSGSLKKLFSIYFVDIYFFQSIANCLFLIFFNGVTSHCLPISWFINFNQWKCWEESILIHLWQTFMSSQDINSEGILQKNDISSRKVMYKFYI